jgi:hypothetical protein
LIEGSVQSWVQLRVTSVAGMLGRGESNVPHKARQLGRRAWDTHHLLALRMCV